MSRIDDIRYLRDKTKASLKLVAAAMSEAGDDIAQAEEIINKELGKRGDTVIASRLPGHRIIISYVHHDSSAGALIELLTETDFAAKNEMVQRLGKDIAMTYAFTDAPAAQWDEMKSIRNPEFTIADLIKEASGVMGEAIKLDRVVRISNMK